MRLMTSICAALMLATVARDPVDARKPAFVRTAQIITMTAAPPAMDVRAPVDEGRVADDASTAAPSLAQSGFRAHDLSRRWVEFDMGSSFASPARAASGASVGGSDPFARGGGARLDPPGSALALPPAPPVFIPNWMRPGLAFSAAAASFAPGCQVGGYRPSGILAPDAENRRSGYYSIMSNIACEYGIPVGLFDAMIIRESRYRADIFSPKNAFGLTQLMPATAAGLGVNRYDVEQNLRGGARYLRQQLDRFGQVHLALAAYNAGPGRVRNGMLPRIAETQAYVDNVLLNWRRLAGFDRVASVENVAVPAAHPPQIGRVATISSY